MKPTSSALRTSLIRARGMEWGLTGTCTPFSHSGFQLSVMIMYSLGRSWYESGSFMALIRSLRNTFGGRKMEEYMTYNINSYMYVNEFVSSKYKKGLNAKTDTHFHQFEIFAIKAAEKQRKYVICLIYVVHVIDRFTNIHILCITFQTKIVLDNLTA